MTSAGIEGGRLPSGDALHHPARVERYVRHGGLHALARLGGRLRNPVLAGTYERVLAEATGPSREARIDAARDAFYRGFVAAAIAEHHDGLLTGDDLARFQAT